MTITHDSLRPKSNNFAVAFSSKDRTELSRQTFARLAAAQNLDIYWFDGSRTPEGQALPKEFANTSNLCGIYHQVVGGPDVAIAYSLQTLYDLGYEYIGLLENDILLTDGWADAALSLFEKGRADGLNPGSVSARAFIKRLMIQRPDYGIMCNHGAAMNIFKREVVPIILDFYRTTTVGEIKKTMADTHGIMDYVFDTPSFKDTGEISADWWFEQILFLHGYHALATTPSMAQNIDEGHAEQYDLYEVKTAQITPRDTERWGKFLTAVAEYAQNLDPLIRLRRYEVHPRTKAHIVYPHQLNTLLPDSFEGGWKHKWCQGMGPFALVAGEDAQVICPPIASRWGFVFSSSKEDEEIFPHMVDYHGAPIKTVVVELDDRFRILLPVEFASNGCKVIVPQRLLAHGISIAEPEGWMFQDCAFDIMQWLKFLN